MKVYVVMAFSGEPYDDTQWVDSVWTTMEDAKEYVEKNPGVINADRKNYDYGYMLSSYITEHEVQ